MKVKCIDAKEFGIPLTEGEVYTVKAHLNFKPECSIKHGKGYTLHEVPGMFFASRFEEVK